MTVPRPVYTLSCFRKAVLVAAALWLVEWDQGEGCHACDETVS